MDEAKKISKEIGYPVLIKASGGGGGKGEDSLEEKDLGGQIELAKNEAKKYFGSEDVFIENISKIQDISIQILSTVQIQYLGEEIVQYKEDIKN